MSLFFGRAVFCLENGRGVPQNYSEADRDYQRSALQENTNGQFRHVTCLHDGMDVAINGLEAAGYYKLAANQRRAGDRLGYAVWVEKCFRLGGSLAEATKFLRLAASRSGQDGQFGSNVDVRQPFGGSIDFDETAKYFKLAADQRVSSAKGIAEDVFGMGVSIPTLQMWLIWPVIRVSVVPVGASATTGSFGRPSGVQRGRKSWIVEGSRDCVHWFHLDKADLKYIFMQ